MAASQNGLSGFRKDSQLALASGGRCQAIVLDVAFATGIKGWSNADETRAW